MNKKLYVIGIGPGSREEMTFRAAHALEECDVIAGYKTYTDLIRADYPDKDYIVTGMTKETDRCRMALERAQDGACVALVSSGDAGVYGMAGLVYQLGTAYPDVDITVIPGITAACSGAARLGAPLMNDFCLISLSDLMTPWETIEKRLDYAAAADFVICLYNPGSHKRADYLRKACAIILRRQKRTVPAGLVHHIGRQGEETKLMTLEELQDVEADMFTTVFIGNSQTEVIDGHMVTPRGYKLL